MRQIIIFAICFVVGASAALIGRSAFHQPYAEQAAAPASMTPATQPEPAPAHEGHPHDHGAHEVTPAPAVPSAAPATALAPADGATVSTAPAGKVVNSICPVCGMDVDPEIPPIAYGDKAIGIACPPCIPKIKRDLEGYGQAALRNERVK